MLFLCYKFRAITALLFFVHAKLTNFYFPKDKAPNRLKIFPIFLIYINLEGISY
jgi:hypothetical protein